MSIDAEKHNLQRLIARLRHGGDEMAVREGVAWLIEAYEAAKAMEQPEERRAENGTGAQETGAARTETDKWAPVSDDNRNNDLSGFRAENLTTSAPTKEQPDERTAFEEWAEQQSWLPWLRQCEYKDGNYDHPELQTAWRAWQGRGSTKRETGKEPSLSARAAADFLNRLDSVLSPVEQLKDMAALAKEHADNLLAVNRRWG